MHCFGFSSSVCGMLWHDHPSCGCYSMWTDAENILKQVRLIEKFRKETAKLRPSFRFPCSVVLGNIIQEASWFHLQYLMFEVIGRALKSKTLLLCWFLLLYCHYLFIIKFCHLLSLSETCRKCAPFCCHFQPAFPGSPIWSSVIARLWTAIGVLPCTKLVSRASSGVKLSEA